MKGFSAFDKNGPDDGPHPNRHVGVIETIQPDGGMAMVRVDGVGLRAMSGLGIAELKEGMDVQLVKHNDNYSIDGQFMDKKLTKEDQPDKDAGPQKEQVGPTAMKKYVSDAQRKAVWASRAEQ